MPAVNFTIIFNKTADFKTIKYSNPIFMQSYVKGSEFSGNFTVRNLTAGVDYTIYCFAQNLNGISSDNYAQVNFTANRKLIRATKSSNFYDPN